MFGLFKKQSSQSQVPKRFFSVMLGEKFVQAALWEAESNVRILAKSEAKPFFNENDLLVKLDGALQELGPESETVHKTLFHLDSSLITGKEIATDKRELFAKITDALQLESLGFVTNTEAIISAKLDLNPELTQQVVVEWISNRVIYSLYDKKTLVETVEGNPNEDFAEQFKGALVQFAAKLGADYAPYFAEKSELEPAPPQAPPLFVNFISALWATAEVQDKVAQLPTELPLKAEVLGSDLLLSYILIPSATIIARSYGWLRDLEAENATEPQESASVPPEEPVAAAEEIPRLSRQKNFTPPPVEKSDFETEKEAEAAKKPLTRAVKKKIVIAAIVLALVVVLAGGFFWLVSQTVATLTLVPKTNTLTKNLEVIIDPEVTTANYDEHILPGQVLAADLEFSAQVATTGKKPVGESAKGKVELINKETKERVLPRGTEIENGTVVFTLDDEVIVPAAERVEEANGDYKVTSGKKESAVTAKTPGTTGNIPKDTTLRVGTFVSEEISARAMEDFTGGSDKTAQYFSDEDEKNTLAEVEEALRKVASEQIESQKGDTYQAIQLDKIKVTSRKFDAKVGDEVEEVTITATGTVPVIAYKLDELTPLSQSALEKELPEGWEFVGEKPDILSAVNEAKTESAGDGIYLDVDLSQAVRTVIDVETLRTQLLGQPLIKANNYLSGQQNVKSYALAWGNSLTPKIFGKLPTSAEKLVIEISND